MAAKLSAKVIKRTKITIFAEKKIQKKFEVLFIIFHCPERTDFHNLIQAESAVCGVQCLLKRLPERQDFRRISPAFG
jgi:hypothetical protein